MGEVATLPFTSRDEWAWRWQQPRRTRSTVMHRIASVVAKHDNDWCPIGVEGTTVCGIAGEFVMPGLFSRLGGPTCAKCRKAVGLKRGREAPHNGYGAPYNYGVDA